MYNHRNMEQLELLPQFEILLNETEKNKGIVQPRPKTIWLNNTELSAPCFAGNFNFLYNGGANEAIITFNTQVHFRKNFPATAKANFIKNLKDAGAAWDEAAEIQVKDNTGNYSKRIRLRFIVKIVTDSRNMNKRTDVFPQGSRSMVLMEKDRENVARELNVFIGSTKPVLAHELGHVWGLKDEYRDSGWKGRIVMGLSPCHVGAGSPIINDNIAIMNDGVRGTGEFRTRYFSHFGRAILNSFWTMPNHIIPVIQNGQVVAKTIQGRVVLLKRNIDQTAPPYTVNRPLNPQYGLLQVAK